MTAQQQLMPLSTSTGTSPLTIEGRFSEFHTHNPQVFNKLKLLALELRRKGFTKFSIKMLYEILRWKYMLEVGPVETSESYQLNNIFTSHYARLLMETCPELKGVFETRNLTAK